MGLKLRRREKKIFGVGCLPLIFFSPPPSKSLYTTRKMKTFCYLTNSAIEGAITEKRKRKAEFHLFLFQCRIDPVGPGSHELHYEAKAVAGNTVQSSQQRAAISIDQCPSTQKQIEIDNTLQQNPTVN